ncbi:MAG: hypothetical protein R2795_19875 [Saprospiraceae bacterium]
MENKQANSNALFVCIGGYGACRHFLHRMLQTDWCHDQCTSGDEASQVYVKNRENTTNSTPLFRVGSAAN